MAMPNYFDAFEEFKAGRYNITRHSDSENSIFVIIRPTIGA